MRRDVLMFGCVEIRPCQKAVLFRGEKFGKLNGGTRARDEGCSDPGKKKIDVMENGNGNVL
jgi:hypothetical protein